MRKEHYSLKQNPNSIHNEWHLFKCELEEGFYVSKKISLCTEMGVESDIEEDYDCTDRRSVLEIITDLDTNYENICGNCMRKFFKTY